jgi:hypothetical protein
MRLRARSSVVVLAFAAVLLAGCSGRTTGATNIARQSDGSYSAVLNAVGSCDQSCTVYMRWRAVDTSDWTNSQPFNVPAVTNVPWTVSATGLTAGTAYEYQACGKEASYSQSVCVGPDGATTTSQKFVAAPGSTDWPQFRFQPDHTAFNPFEITITPDNAKSLTPAWTATTG